MRIPDFCDQSPYALRCDWGLHGVYALSPASDVVVIVDVLSFSTCVDIGTARGASMFPYAMDEDDASGYAAAVNAEVAAARGQGRWTLSPSSWLSSDKTTRVVLPSINGARLCARADAAVVIAGCLRNARAVAKYAQTVGKQIAVIPAGERWPDGSLRPCIEDWLGAGAILGFLQGIASPEAHAAIGLFESSREELHERIAPSASGRELVEAGFSEDIRLATELNVSECVPLLREGRFCRGPAQSM